MKYLIVGLGNLSPEYYDTRHNIGFRMADAFASAHNATFRSARYGDMAELTLKRKQLLVLKPSTYMNLSGKAVRYWLRQEKIPEANLLVLVDDTALPFGALRLKPKGSSGGHNGLQNIIDLLGTPVYARLRFGIGNNYPSGGQIDYVLSAFTPEELQAIPDRLTVAAEIIQAFCLDGIQPAMNRYNKTL